jgi:hypothetical protein
MGQLKIAVGSIRRLCILGGACSGCHRAGTSQPDNNCLMD